MDLVDLDKPTEILKMVTLKDASEVDELYTKSSKKIYAEILDFIAMAESKSGKKYYKQLDTLKDINIKIVENIKLSVTSTYKIV